MCFCNYAVNTINIIDTEILREMRGQQIEKSKGKSVSKNTWYGINILELMDKTEILAHIISIAEALRLRVFTNLSLPASIVCECGRDSCLRGSNGNQIIR